MSDLVVAVGKAEFSQESSAIIPEARPLIAANHEEVGHSLGYPLDLNSSVYHDLECAGALRIYTVRVDGRLVGYATFVLSKTPHCAGEIHASQDAVYLHRDERRGPLGTSFLRYCDERLRDEGVKAVQHSMPADRDCGAILRRLGYRKAQHVYLRRFDQWD